MLRVQGSLRADTLGDALMPDEGDGVVVIDLANASFIEPAGLVAIAAIADRAAREGKAVEFVRPKDGNVRNYLARMHVSGVLDGLGIAHTLPKVNETPLQDTLLELQKFSDQSDGEALAAVVFDKVMGKTDAYVPDALYSGICELAGNVCFHAVVEHGFAAAQTIPARNCILFAVADGGIGVQKSLESTHAPANATEALLLAIKYGVSGTGEQGRGSGLSDVMDTVGGGLGEYTLVSGDAILVKRSKSTPLVGRLDHNYPGTLFAGQLGC